MTILRKCKAGFAILCSLILPGFLLAEVKVLRSDNWGVALTYSPGKMVYNLVNGKTRVSFEDADEVADFGDYNLPAKIIRVGIPQNGNVRLKFKTVPGGVIQNAEPEKVKFIRFDNSESENAPQDSSAIYLYPSEPVQISPPEMLRSVRFVTLKFNPVQYNSRTEQLLWHQQIEVELDFDQPAKDNFGTDPLDNVIAQMLINGTLAKDWKVNSGQNIRNPFKNFPFWLKITIDSEGIYCITGRELQAAGVPLIGVDPKTISLWTIGTHQPNEYYPDTLTPVALLIRGEEDGRLDLNDSLIFFALGPDHYLNCCSTYFHNLYADENVYWLTWGSGMGKRIQFGFGPDTTATPVLNKGSALLHQELDLDCPARAGLLWIWATLHKPQDRADAGFTTTLDLKYPVQVEKISGKLYNETPQNQLQLLFNHRPIFSFTFGASSYPEPYYFTIDTLLPVNYSQNTLELRLSGTGEKKVHLDYLEIKYQRRLSLAEGQLNYYIADTGTYRFCVIDAPRLPIIFNITDPYNPRGVEPCSYQNDTLFFAYRIHARTLFHIAEPRQFRKPQKIELKTPGRLWDEDNYADYYIITPREFIGPAEELARYRRNRISGLNNSRAKAVILEDLYDAFAFGLKEPGAVKRFLQITKPVYVLLVGDATYDYRNNLKRVQTPGVPAYELGEGLNPESGDRRTLTLDAWYADLEGAGASPDLILGRVTVRSGYEFRQFVQKVIDYENKSTGYWTRRYLLLADDEYLSYPSRPDELRFRHIEQCEGMGILAGNRLDQVKVYLTEFPFMGTKSKPDASRELLRQLNLGALLWVFFGHGSAYALTHEEVLTVNRLNDIKNGLRLPFCFMGSCSVGRFDDTRQECIGEELVRMPGGAIACVAASTATPSGNNLVFARNLLTPLLTATDTLPTIGVCFYQAWPSDRSYHLFGDPAITLKMPARSAQPVLINPDTLQAGKSFRVRSIVELSKGNAEWRLFGPVLERNYYSPLGLSISYIMPGNEIGRGNFRVKDGRFFAEGFFPAGIVQDTIFTGNGFYVPLPGSSRFSAVVSGDSGLISVLKENIEFRTRVENQQDSSGPEVIFSYQGRRLKNGDSVPGSFELEIAVQDQSGILVAPIANLEPELFINDYRTKIGINDWLVFDDSSYSSCRCRIPLQLNGPQDSIFVLVADNLLNRTRAHIMLTPLVSQVLQIDSVMVFPNPVKGTAFFTFFLSMPAAVRVRIWTLGGRLVRDLGIYQAGFGYNQIYWDGKDQQGDFLPNGVYLFVLSAETKKGQHQIQRRTIRDKLLIVR